MPRGAGVCGFIVPDLPLDESSELRAALDARADSRWCRWSRRSPSPSACGSCVRGSQGFVYAVTMTGTTGKNVAVPEEVLAATSTRVRAASPLPVCAGFGIRSREQVARLRGHVDGVVVGSALVEVLERGADVAAWLRLRYAPGT